MVSQKMDLVKLGLPLHLVGRQAQFQQLTKALVYNRDVIVAGVPGSGRRTLVRLAAEEVKAKILEIDCIRITDGQRFIQLFWEELYQVFKSERNLIRDWINQEAAKFFDHKHNRINPLLNSDEVWECMTKLIMLPQLLSDGLSTRIVISFESFPHIRSWDKHKKWESLIRNTITSQNLVSYVLITTIAEAIIDNNQVVTITLTPVSDEIIATWIQEILHLEQLSFDPTSNGLELFVQAVQGHLGYATALARRLKGHRTYDNLISSWQVEVAIKELLSDLSTIYESLLMLLPASQVHLLESLAIDPTDKPQSQEYINKHGLSRGGSLQGALMGLQHKGLIYGQPQKYRIALPLLALWIKQRLI